MKKNPLATLFFFFFFLVVAVSWFQLVPSKFITALDHSLAIEYTNLTSY